MEDDTRDSTVTEFKVDTLVCQRVMTTKRESYYPAEYQGQIIYFCTEFCRDSFYADPDRFYTAHHRKKG